MSEITKISFYQSLPNYTSLLTVDRSMMFVFNNFDFLPFSTTANKSQRPSSQNVLFQKYENACHYKMTHKIKLKLFAIILEIHNWQWLYRKAQIVHKEVVHDMKPSCPLMNKLLSSQVLHIFQPESCKASTMHMTKVKEALTQQQVSFASRKQNVQRFIPLVSTRTQKMPDNGIHPSPNTIHYSKCDKDSIQNFRVLKKVQAAPK